MSPALSNREAMPPEAASPSSSTTTHPMDRKLGRSKKINWDKVKVFDKPEYRLPFKLSKYTQGRGGYEPEPWLQAAIESGLVEMGSLEKGGRVGEWLEPIGDHPPARMKREELEALMAKCLAEMLEK